MTYYRADLHVFFEKVSKTYEVLQLETDYNNVYSQQSGSIQKGSPFLLIFKMDLNNDARRYFQYKEILKEKKPACYQLIKDIYACRFEDVDALAQYPLLQVETHSSTPVQLIHGLKVGFNTYLAGCGPSILQQENSIVPTLIKIGYGTISLSAYDPAEARPGKYLLIIPGYPRVSFHIQELVPNEAIISPSIGLKYDNWRLNRNEYDVAGCFFTKEVTQAKQLLREWIQVQIQEDYRNTDMPLIIQVLNRSRYGKSSG